MTSTSDTSTAPVPVPTVFEMYTAAGDAACAHACEEILAVAADHARVHNRDTLAAAARAEVAKVAAVHGEVHDTEPRTHISNFLDRICGHYGWAYDAWASYDL